MIDFIVGGPATGEDFLFRETELENLWDSLRKDNILFLAPRRMGKTSVMDRLREKPQHDYLVVYLNVEELKSPGEFCLNLLNALHECQPNFLRDSLAKSWDLLKSVLGKIEKMEAFEFKIALKSEFKDLWKDRADQLIERINRSEQKILFLLDELPDMLIRMQKMPNDELDIFLNWFRKIRLNRNSRIRWLVAGSVNIEGTLDRIGQLKLINDLDKVILPPFSHKEVETFVTTMLGSRSVEFEPEVIPVIMELLGEPIPLFLQMLTQEIYRYWKGTEKQKITPEEVKQIFEKSLLGERARDKLQHFRSRIDLHYPEEEQEATCRILDRLSLSKEGFSRSTLFVHYRQTEEKKSVPRKEQTLKLDFNRLLLLLESDFYIRETSEQRFDFANKLLKQWWKKYYGYDL